MYNYLSYGNKNLNTKKIIFSILGVLSTKSGPKAGASYYLIFLLLGDCADSLINLINLICIYL